MNALPQNNNRNRNNDDALSISDEELQFIIDNYDQFDHNNLIEQIVSVFRKNQIIFLFVLILEMLLSCTLLIMTWKKKEASILIMQEIYKDLNSMEASLLFHTIYFITVILNIMYYPLSFYALSTKKVKVFRLFSTLSLYTAITTIFIIYINM